MNIDANALSMDETEFESNMQSARALLSGLSEDSDMFNHCDKTPVSRAESLEHVQQSLNTKKHQEPLVQSQHLFGSSEKKLGNKVPSISDLEQPYKVPSTSDLENKGASILMKEDQVSQIFQKFPYVFSQAGDLTVSDVEELLDHYKQVVFKYVCLSTGLGLPNLSPPFSSLHQSELSKKESGDSEADLNEETNKNANTAGEDLNAVSLLELEISESNMPPDGSSSVSG